ncbi:Aminoacyl-histidine dipeptidase [sediment metagenome]|uniref:Aminoacyl-histidine dipeptidase n=1 Tax=sediment metagenome TaxID=749907 RepID=D9PJG3_9ZZZZ
MRILNELNPANLWYYFEEICSIPRISRDEGKIRRYLLDFAKENNLQSKEDIVGNILITRGADPGFENIKTVVLQSHLDMVGEKNADHPHNWKTDPIRPVIRDGWITASGTTLGADDGIGIAAQMAILTDNTFKTGKIECLFTVDEESGMTGAVNLNPDFFTGRTLLNLDSEDEGILYIGCAGGMDTVGTIHYNPVPVRNNSCALELSVTGLRGGHSGDEIHKGYGNAVKIMNRLILYLAETYEVNISFLNAGNLRNAIPREAFATIVTDISVSDSVKNSAAIFFRKVREEFHDLEKDIKISVNDADLPGSAMDMESQKKLTDAIECCPHGVIAWSKDMEDLVETSTNLASVKFSDNNTIIIVTTQRSSVDSAKREVAAGVVKCLRPAGAEIKHSDGYPGWKPDITSEILRITRNSYKNLFGKDPHIRAIHAGLECGLIYEKVKGIDMISFGPTIRGAHTPEERIDIKSTQIFWELLTDILKNMPATSY